MKYDERVNCQNSITLVFYKQFDNMNGGIMMPQKGIQDHPDLIEVIPMYLHVSCRIKIIIN